MDFCGGWERRITFPSFLVFRLLLRFVLVFSIFLLINLVIVIRQSHTCRLCIPVIESSPCSHLSHHYQCPPLNPVTTRPFPRSITSASILWPIWFNQGYLVTIGLELSIEAWCDNQWVQNWKWCFSLLHESINSK